MSKPRNFFKYEVYVKNKIVHGGITKNLEQRKEQHRDKYGNCTIRQIGIKCTEDGARAWEKKKGYS